MKHLKMFGLLAIAAAALMALVGTASATITSPAGTKFNGTLKMSSTNSELTGSVDVKCANSTLESTVNNGATSGSVTALTFTNCGVDTVSVLAKGTLSISSDGQVSSSGAIFTIQVHRKDPIFGFPITTHCIYWTGGNGLGKLWEGTSPGVLYASSTPIPQIETDGLCYEDTFWQGKYTVSNPSGAITVD